MKKKEMKKKNEGEIRFQKIMESYGMKWRYKCEKYDYVFYIVFYKWHTHCVILLISMLAIYIYVDIKTSSC